ncbi:unnamed protein product [Peronospora belbahrii]|uniref:Uncharacterized protein n=1 Tax=Peronospora belbahrii TaxID=622444 RepID=A0AAU9KWW4_9STRA|nr:unnamed protein product [Peronospora belbahrii]
MQEQAARSTLEKEARLRELELHKVQQRSSQVAQQAFKDHMGLENELEDEVAMHKVAVVGRNAATQQNTALTVELKTMEANWTNELEEKENALEKLELAADEVHRLKAEREQIVQRTESDAKRVRELWWQIAREHEVRVEELKQELLNAQQLPAGAKVTVAGYQKKIAKLEEELRMTWKEKNAFQEQLLSARDHFLSAQKESDRMKEDSWRSEQHRITLELQELKSMCKLHAQQQQATVKKRDAAIQTLRKTEEALNASTEELLALKTKFANLLDKHEALTAQLKQTAYAREAELILRAQKLSKGKRYAEELAMLRKAEISGYKRVIDSVDARLTETQELSESSQRNAWSLPQDARKVKSSLCIYRH